MRTWVQSLDLFSGLRIGVAESCGVGQFGSHIGVAVVQASSYSSDLTPSLGTSICSGGGLKKTKKKEILKEL